MAKPMKEVRGRALHFARDLVFEAKRPKDLMEKYEVSLSSWKRWRKDGVFQAKVRELQTEFEAAITHVRYSSKRRRLEELERQIVDCVDDKGPDKILEVDDVPFDANGDTIPVDADNRPILDPGERVARWGTRRILVMKSNALEIAKLLRDMKDELEPIKAQLSTPDGAPLEVDLLARRQKEANDLAQFDKDQQG